MHIRKIVDIMELDLERCRIGFVRADFEKRICDFNFELPGESWNPWEIILPDTDDVTIHQNSLKFRPDFLNAMLEMIHREVPETNNFEDAIVITVFSILHEIGHLCNFEEKGMSKEDYIREERSERERVTKIEEFAVAFKEYRDLPNEKAADQFAFKYLVEELNKIENMRE